MVDLHFWHLGLLVIMAVLIRATGHHGWPSLKLKANAASGEAVERDADAE
jgi:hypothetical protein